MKADVRRWLVARLVALANWVGGSRVGAVSFLREPQNADRYVDLPHAAQVTFTYTPDEDEIAERVIRKIDDRLRMRGVQLPRSGWPGPPRRHREKEPQG